MKDVFADTFYYLALLNKHDVAHQRSLEATRSVRGQFFTTAYVLNELADGLASTRNRPLVKPFLNQLQQDIHTNVIAADATWLRLGLDLYHDRPDKAWSLTDCISFVVMREHGLTEALTADHHFEQAGFVVLL